MLNAKIYFLKSLHSYNYELAHLRQKKNAQGTRNGKADSYMLKNLTCNIVSIVTFHMDSFYNITLSEILLKYTLKLIRFLIVKYKG